MDAVQRALKGGKLERSDISDLAQAVGLDKGDFWDLAGVLEGDASASAIRVYPARILNATELYEPKRYAYFRGQQEVYRWARFDLLGRNEVYAVTFRAMHWRQKLQLLRVMLIRTELSERVSYSLWPTVDSTHRSQPIIDVAYQEQEFADVSSITNVGDPIAPKDQIGGIDIADVLGRDLLSEHDVSRLLNLSPRHVMMKWIHQRGLPPALQVTTNSGLFWIKSTFFEAFPDLEEAEESQDPLIDLNGISKLVGGNKEVFRLSRERKNMPVGEEIDGRTYWRESEILGWIGRQRREAPERTYGDDDLWDFDDLARFLNRTRHKIDEVVADESFPPGVVLDDQTFWPKAEVQQWLADVELNSLDERRPTGWRRFTAEMGQVYRKPKRR